jgi:L,D-transpeptidase catalytic domain
MRLVYFRFMSRTIRGLLSLSAALLLAPAAVSSAASGAALTPVASTPTATTTPGTTTTPAATTTPATTTPAAPKPKPKRKPQAAKGSVSLYLPDAFFVSRAPVTVPGRTLHVDGVVHPYRSGQWITVRAFLGRRLIKTDQLRIRPSRKRTYGRFTEKLKSPGVGGVTVTATHSATKQLNGFDGSRRYSALDERIGFGSRGRFVELIQQRLAALHFYIPQSGVYDNGTGLALDAYHRLLGWGTSQSLDGATISELLNQRGAFQVRYPSHGRHAEGNLAKQLLALVNGSHVDLIFPISSGKPSTPTVLGSFRIYRRDPGYLSDGMYYSSFFIGGYAIHGFNPAPDYPASHGCMRLPIPDAITAYSWLTFGDGVDVYY